MSARSVERQKVYDFCVANGLVWSPEVHVALKALLLEYVGIENSLLDAEAKAWRSHQIKCKMFEARKQARKDRAKAKQTPNVKKA